MEFPLFLPFSQLKTASFNIENTKIINKLSETIKFDSSVLSNDIAVAFSYPCDVQ